MATPSGGRHRTGGRRLPATLLPFIAGVAGMIGHACAPPTVRYFEAAPAGYTSIGTIADTMLVYPLGPVDTISVDGVQWVSDLRRRAERERASQVVRILEPMWRHIPDSIRATITTSGDPGRHLWRHLNAQGPTVQFTVARADAIVIRQLTADTVTVSTSTEAVPRRWMAIVVAGTLWSDPQLGVRANVR